MFAKILIILLILLPAANAWSWDTHQNIIEYVYLALPVEAQMKLDITKLKEGAVMPDKIFKDHRMHHYPESLEEARKWLNNDTDLSLNIGIASHYITDSFAAPHNIFGEDYNKHAQFENQVDKYYPNVECGNYGFKLENLKIATKNSQDWNLWLKTKDKNIPRREVDEAAKFLFSIVLPKLNVSCGIKTEAVEVPYFNKYKIIIIGLVSALGLYLLKD